MSAEKHELLHNSFGVNYNDLDPRFRKGSVIVRETITAADAPFNKSILDGTDETLAVLEHAAAAEGDQAPRHDQDTSPPAGMQRASPQKPKRRLVVMHCDLIEDAFWTERPELLE